MTSKKPLFGFGSGSGKEYPEYNIALVGAFGVGKSAITVKYITRRFITEYNPTLEDIFSKVDSIDSQDLTVKIFDTFDGENADPTRYLKWANGVAVVYSITSRPTFSEARSYLEIISQYQKQAAKDIPVVLVGNKMDFERYRTISKRTGEELATEFDSLFLETSAAEDFESVEKIFHSLVREISRLTEHQLPLQSLFISEDKSGLLSHGQQQQITKQSFSRTKSPKSTESKEVIKKEEKTSAVTRKNASSTFKLFNKSFKIFN